nr:E3 ubiquitin-protein ligase ORTHRUS 2-like [Tanacetum cinerariifolium]
AVKEVAKTEAVAKSPKVNKKRKVGQADNAPNKKLHEETDTLMGDAVIDTANEINDASVQPESVEIEEPKVEKLAKGGKKTTKQKKDVEAKSSTPSSPASRTRSKMI